MISPRNLSQWCNNFLLSHEFSDYCPNGLQVEADIDIDYLITGVTACEDLINIAIKNKAQAIMVHHGYFWKGEDQRLIGMKGKRIRKLMQHGISLIAYHLPLDAHPQVGNNAQLGLSLELDNMQPLYPNEKHSIGNIFSTDISLEQLKQRISQKLNREPLHIATGKNSFQRIGICTGAAQNMIEQAKIMGCDVFISGEVSERTTHEARELGIDYFACGHHATEIGGIKSFGEVVKKELNINVEFINIENPV